MYGFEPVIQAEMDKTWCGSLERMFKPFALYTLFEMTAPQAI